MKALEVKHQIALKNILFATDFEVSASRALPFAVALANGYEAKLYAAHVIPLEAYALASPELIDRVLKEAGDFAGYTLNQIIGSLRCRGLRCDVLLGEGNVADVLEEWVQTYSADLVVVGTISRAGWGKVVLGSVAEEVIREATCPVLIETRERVLNLHRFGSCATIHQASGEIGRRPIRQPADARCLEPEERLDVADFSSQRL
jgi:nucleotide-binding universal stress UspA family protein